MSQNKKYQSSIRWTQPYGDRGSVPYHHITGWRKRQTLDRILDDLHTQQLQMIDDAVDRSDLRDAKELIDYIRQK